RFREAKAKESMDRQSDRHPEIARAKGCAFSAKVKWELREADTHLGQRPCGRANRPDTNPQSTGQFRLKSALDPWGASTQPLAQLVRQPPRRDRWPAAPGDLGAQTRQRPTAIVARVFVQDRRGDRPGMRPDLGLLSWPLAPPQPRHSAMYKVTPPVAHRTGVHPENRGDLLGAPPLQRQQDRPRPVRFAAVLRF